MGIHFRDVRGILRILKDIKKYILIQNKNDKLGESIITQVDRVLNDNKGEIWK